MICPICRCVFCSDQDGDPKRYCSATCKKKARRTGNNPGPDQRKRLKRWKRIEWERQGKTCPLCNEQIAELADAVIGHIVPRSHGGHMTRDNLNVAHRWCDEAKGDTCPGCPQCQPSPVPHPGKTQVNG